LPVPSRKLDRRLYWQVACRRCTRLSRCSLLRRKKPVAFVACMAVAVSSIGIPVPCVSGSRTGAIYPCAGCSCGCIDAETCWRSCCCFTNQQKLAWARRNRVMPPAFVLAAAKREACCGDKHEGHCESSVCHAATCNRPCCARRAAVSCCEAPTTRAERQSDSRVVLLISALRCRGLTPTVSLLPPSLPIKFGATRPFPPGLAQRVCMAVSLYEPPTLLIASPPPEALAA
jgi:hypothetical protein